MTLDKEFKEAVLALPTKEKDKLLLKLIAKNETLVRQLEFELLEFGESIELRKNAIKIQIDRVYKMNHMSPGWLMMDMRSLNSLVTDHVKITKDKYGEVELTLYLLVEMFKNQEEHVQKNKRDKAFTLGEYVAKRTEFILKKIVKLHPDIQFDFYKDLNFLLENINISVVKNHALELGIPNAFEIKDS
jgi:ribosomal protein S15P/S13E